MKRRFKILPRCGHVSETGRFGICQRLDLERERMQPGSPGAGSLNWTGQCAQASRLSPVLNLGWRLWIVLVCCLATTMVSGQSPNTSPHVLVLVSYHAGYSWSDGELQGVLRVLSREFPGIIPSVEFLDAKRDPSPAHVSELFHLALEKYEGHPADLVVTLDDAAFQTALKHRPELGTNVPIVFGGLNDFEPEMLAGQPKITGVAEAFDFAGNLDLILQLLPETRAVAVVYDSAESTVLTREAFRKVAQSYTNRLQFLDVTGWTAEDLTNRLAALPPHTAGLVLGNNRDATGRLVSEDVTFLRALADNTPIPLFMISQPYLPLTYGYGWDHAVWFGVGGNMLSSDGHGEAVGQMAAQILKGEPVENLPPLRTSPARLAFDYPQFMRHHLDISRLPAGAELFNRSLTFYEQYKLRILATLSLIAILCLVILALVINILGRRKAERALRQSHERFELVGYATNDAVWDLDLTTGGMWWNDQFTRMLLMPPDTVPKRRRWEEAIHPADRAKVVAGLLSAETGQAGLQAIEHRFVRADGSVGYTLQRARLQRDPAGRLVRAVGSMLDITDRRKREEELSRKNEELERFTYTVSHDLKSPLITIRGFTGALIQDVAAGRQERISGDLQRIASATDKMGELLNDLLELSRVGRIVNPPADVNLAELIVEVSELLSGTLNRQSVRMVVQPGLPVVRGDRRRLLEVYQNLIENAARFMGEQTEPRIEIGVRGEGVSRLFFVRDNGVGIDPRHHETVFNLFSKLDAKTEGSGIGLALVRRIVEVHGGQVWVESAGVGHGCTFCFTLPESPCIRKEKQR